jgi:hypothetical protein
MQGMIVTLLFISVVTFGVIENKRSNPSEVQTLSMFKADDIAANLMAFGDLYYQYIQAHYETFHSIRPTNVGKVEGVLMLNTPKDTAEIKKYNLKNLRPMLNYKVLVFNYTRPDVGNDALPTLYLVIMWDSIAPEFKNYQYVNLAEVAGQMNQLFGKRIYQGDSSFWTIPWIGYKNENEKECKLQEVYSQVPLDHNSQSRMKNIVEFFKTYCGELEYVYGIKLSTYIYVQPVYKIDPASI